MKFKFEYITDDDKDEITPLIHYTKSTGFGKNKLGDAVVFPVHSDCIYGEYLQDFLSERHLIGRVHVFPGYNSKDVMMVYLFLSEDMVNDYTVMKLLQFINKYTTEDFECDWIPDFIDIRNHLNRTLNFNAI